MIELGFLALLCCSLLAAAILSLRQVDQQERERAIQDALRNTVRLVEQLTARMRADTAKMQRANARAIEAFNDFGRAAAAAQEALARIGSP